MAQFIHDISNVAQNMMIASYERQIGGNSMAKIDKNLFELKKLIEIYRCVFLELEYLDYGRFEQLVEDLNLLYDREIELEEEGFLTDSKSFILEVLAIYLIWISKNEEIELVHISAKKGYVKLKKSGNLEQYIRSSDLRLKRMIDQLLRFNNLITYLDEKDRKIYVEAQPF